MKSCTVSLKSVSPYSSSRFVTIPKKEKEGADDYENRVWREKCTTDENGIVCIPAMGFKQALDTAARMLGQKIPGKRNSTYTKHFRAGVIVENNVSIGIRKEDMSQNTIFANADGVRGSGKRVIRHFPTAREWRGKAVFLILDDTITKEVFTDHLREAGKLVGVGQFRPENGGFFGRFEIEEIRWN